MKILAIDSSSLVATVAVVQDDIQRYHNEIGEIEPEGQVEVMRQRLGDNAAYITGADEIVEHDALAAGGAATDRLRQIDGPGNTKAQDHQSFQHFCQHSNSLFSLFDSERFFSIRSY